MFFLPISLILFILVVLLLPFFLLILHIEIIKIALGKLGVSPGAAFLIFLLSLAGSLINIPLFKSADQQIIAVNVGGCIIPLLLCVYLLPKAPFLPTFFATVIMVVICFRISNVVPGVGITIPALLPPLAAVLLAFIFSPRNKIPVAYISGVLGVLIGADLMNIPNLQGYTGIMSIGGAGVFDGIFLVGIISALLA